MLRSQETKPERSILSSSICFCARKRYLGFGNRSKGRSFKPKKLSYITDRQSVLKKVFTERALRCRPAAHRPASLQASRCLPVAQALPSVQGNRQAAKTAANQAKSVGAQCFIR